MNNNNNNDPTHESPISFLVVSRPDHTTPGILFPRLLEQWMHSKQQETGRAIPNLYPWRFNSKTIESATGLRTHTEARRQLTPPPVNTHVPPQHQHDKHSMLPRHTPHTQNSTTCSPLVLSALRVYLSEIASSTTTLSTFRKATLIHARAAGS